MVSGPAAAGTQVIHVGMGQAVLGAHPSCLTAVLGSCLGVALYHPRLRLGAMSHVVLPCSNGRESAPGKFADTAIPHMIGLLKARGATSATLVAKIAGGACMFGGGGPLQIGAANAEAVRQALKAAGIAVASEDIGGTSGRRVRFHCDSGTLTVERAGMPPREL